MTSSEKKKYDELVAEFGEEHLGAGDERDPEWHWTRWKATTDLYWLGTNILGLERAKKRVHPPLHRWLCNVLSLEDDKMVLIPRKHAKTTWTIGYIVMLILKTFGRIRILYLSRTEKLVVKNLNAVKRYLALPLLRRLFPEIIPDPGKEYRGWKISNQNELLLKEYKDMISSEPNVVAYGAASAFTGAAVDEIILDDYIDDKTCGSATLMEQALEDWRYLQPLLDYDAIVTIIGTFYHYNDLYNTIIREKHFPQNRVFIRRVQENGKFIYPTMFNKKRMEKLRKKLTSYILSCQFYLNPTPKQDQIFPGPQPVCTQLPKQDYKYYLLVDPAPTIKKTSNSTGFAVAAINKQMFIYFVEAFKVKKKGADKADLIIKLCLKYRFEKIGIEYGLQQDLDYIIKLKKSQYEKDNNVRVYMPIEPIALNNKQSKGDRIYLTLGQFVRNGRVQIVESGCYDLIRQMDLFTGKGKEEDDVVDAASMLFPLVDQFHVPSSLIDRINPAKGTFFDIFKKKVRNDWRSNFA